MDFSEQELICCHNPLSTNPHFSPLNRTKMLNYLKNNGVGDELTYPFVCESFSPCIDSLDFIDFAKIKSYTILQRNMDLWKSLLIHNGPIVSGFSWVTDTINNLGPSHAMTLVGYGKIDTLVVIRDRNNFCDTIRLEESDVRIGKTYWIFKNSYGEQDSDMSEHNGFLYVLLDSTLKYTIISFSFELDYPIKRNGTIYTTIVCEDADEDGFYYWGIGPKPAHCPAGAPDTPDGDDSNPLYGPMNEYGYLESLNPNDRDTIYITTSTISSQIQHFYNHVVLCNGATWDIQDNVTFHNGAKMIIRENAHLNVKANGALRGANVISKSSSQVNVEDGGQIIRPTNGEIKVELGSSFELNEGCIQ